MKTSCVRITNSGEILRGRRMRYRYFAIAAAILITASPLILLYIVAQRYIVAGITSGAIKG